MALDDIKLYDLKEAGDVLGVGSRSVWNYLKAGRLTGRKIGGKWKISEAELRRFMEPEAGQGDNMAAYKGKDE